MNAALLAALCIAGLTPEEEVEAWQPFTERTVDPEDEAHPEPTATAVRGADRHGGEMKLHLVDTRTGQETWSAVRMTTLPARVTLDAKGVASLDYAHALDVPCDPRVAGCVEQVRTKNAIAVDVTLDFDVKRCEPKGRIARDDVLQLGVPARIDDLAKPAPRFLGGALACAASP